jgi:hypothetical protein
VRVNREMEKQEQKKRGGVQDICGVRATLPPDRGIDGRAYVDSRRHAAREHRPTLAERGEQDNQKFSAVVPARYALYLGELHAHVL